MKSVFKKHQRSYRYKIEGGDMDREGRLHLYGILDFCKHKSVYFEDNKYYRNK